MSTFILTENRPCSSRGRARFALQVRLADVGPDAICPGVWADLRLALTRIGRPSGYPETWERAAPAISFAWERALIDTRRREQRIQGDEAALEEARVTYYVAVIEAERQNADDYLHPPDPSSEIEEARSGAHWGRIIGAGNRRADALRATFGLV